MTEETLFHQALAISDPKQRDAFLDQACQGQPRLKRDLELLLQAHEASRNPLNQSPLLPPSSAQDLPATLDATAEFVEQQPAASAQHIGRYQLVEKIGEGGMGEVWVARQVEPIKRKVALKLVKAGMDSRAVLQRFEQERQALAMMDHPNIARVLDGGMSATGQPYFVMELVNGLPITRFCDEMKLSPRERLELFLPLCQAVQHAHYKGIVHRDLKPSNILVTQIDGRPVPKIIDFGVAKALGGKLTDESLYTQFGAVVGTLEYMAPEQAGFSGQDVDSRADLYSLGVVLYELLTGLKPLDVKRLQKAAWDEILRMIREEEAPSLSSKLSTETTLPSLAAVRQMDPKRLIALMKGELDWIVRKCLEKDRNRRYDTASSLARDVEHYLHDEPVEARPASTSYRLRKFIRRHRGVVSAASLLVLTLLVGIIGTTWGWQWAMNAEQQALFDRDRANQLAVAAQESSTRAIHSAIANRKLYDQTLVNRGLAAERDGDLLKAMQWYLEPLRTPHPDQRQRDLHLLRLGLYLQHAALPRLALQLSIGAIGSKVQFSPDGKRLMTLVQKVNLDATSQSEAAQLFGVVQLWDARTGELEHVIKIHGQINHAEFSRDGLRIVTASGWNEDGIDPWGEWAVWEAATGKRLALHRQKQPVLYAQCSPDGLKVVTASIGHTAQVWDAATGQPLTPPIKHSQMINQVIFSPDGLRVATASDDNTARIWDAATGQPLTPPLQHTGLVLRVRFRKDGHLLGTASADGTARIWDAATGKPLLSPLQHLETVYDIQFSPNGLWVATASADKTARVWDLATGRPLTPALTHQSEVVHAQFSPDGTWLLTASGDNTACVWDVLSGKRLFAPLRHQRWIYQACFSPDGRRVATISHDQTARLWDLPTGPILRDVSSIHQTASPLDYKPTQHRWLSWDWDGWVTVWDTQTGKERARYHYPSRVTGARLFPDGERAVVFGFDDALRVISTTTGEPLTPLMQHKGFIIDVDCSADGRLIASASYDRTTRLWNAHTGQPLTPPLVHEDAINFVRFSPDGKLFVTCSYDDTARVWEVAGGKLKLPPLRHSHSVYHAAFSPNGQRLITASEDKTARVWNLATGRPVTPPLPHDAPVVFCSFSPDNRLVITADENHFARLWEAETGEPLSPMLPCIAAEIRFEDADHVRLSHQELLTLKPIVENTLTNDQSLEGAWTLADVRSWILLTQIGQPLDVADPPLSPKEMQAEQERLRQRFATFFNKPAQDAAWHRARISELLTLFRYVELESSKARLSYAVQYHLEQLERLEPEHRDTCWLRYRWALLQQDYAAAEWHARAMAQRGSMVEVINWIETLFDVYGLRSEVAEVIKRTSGWTPEQQVWIRIGVASTKETTSTLHRLAWEAVTQPDASTDRLRLAQRQIEAAIRFQPNHADIQQAYAWVLLRLGQLADAEKAFDQSMQLRRSYFMDDQLDVRQLGSDVCVLLIHPWNYALTRLRNGHAIDCAGMALIKRKQGDLARARLWLDAGWASLKSLNGEIHQQAEALLNEVAKEMQAARDKTP